jgi:hypothetical protein
MIAMYCTITAAWPTRVVVIILLYHAATRLDGGSQVCGLARSVPEHEVDLLLCRSLTYWSHSAPLFRSWFDINQEAVNRFEERSRPFRKHSG